MTAEELKTTVRHLVERAYNQGELQALGQLYSDDLVYRRPPLADIEGLTHLRQYLLDVRSAFSDIQFAITRIILEGDIHAGLWTFRATHTGRSPAMPIPPRSRQVRITGSTMGVWAGGEIVEEWNYVDWLGLFRQLGVMPPTG
jgi:predicted ester cyclase